MKLELKHIVPYSQHRVRCKVNRILCQDGTWEITGFEQYQKSLGNCEYEESYSTRINILRHSVGSFVRTTAEIENIKMFLRPLSDLTKEIEVNGERFIPIDRLKEMYNAMPDSYIEKLQYVKWYDQFTLFGLEEDNSYEVSMPYSLYEKLFEWHFDVFGLLEASLAIDINTFKN